MKKKSKQSAPVKEPDKAELKSPEKIKRPRRWTLARGILIFSSLNILLIIGVIILLVFIRFNAIQSLGDTRTSQSTFSYFLKRPDLLASAKALVVYDVNSGVTLLSKNQNLRFSPASTAKIMTALVALDYYKPETPLTAYKLSENPDSSKMGLYIGEQMTVLDLLYGMLLPSGGDAAEVLAENYLSADKVGLSAGRQDMDGTDAFIGKMNAKAKKLGLTNTYFSDPAGYNDDNYSTAYDLARLGAYALQNDTFKNIVKTKKMTVYNVQHTTPHLLENLNELLEIPNVTGIKTGFTNEAEGVLATSFVHNGKTYIIVVLGSQDRFADTRLLIEAIIKDLRSESVNP